METAIENGATGEFELAVRIMDVSEELVASFRLVEMYFMECVHGSRVLVAEIKRMKALADRILEMDARLTNEEHKKTTLIAVNNANNALKVYGRYKDFVENYEA